MKGRGGLPESDTSARQRAISWDDLFPVSAPNSGVVRADLVALTLVMEGRLALDDAVRVLMARQGLDRDRATEAIVRAAAFASDEYGGHPLDLRVANAL